MMVILYSFLFIISLYALFRLEYTANIKVKLLLISLFIIINAIFLVNLSFPDDKKLGMLYNGIICSMLIFPVFMVGLLKKSYKSNALLKSKK